MSSKSKTLRKKGMGSHQSHNAGKTEWLTPPRILKALGPFDLDPCAPVDRPWDMAKNHYTKLDNGLEKEWYGRIWLNPPYGVEAEPFLERLAQHGHGIALMFARTETKMFFKHVWDNAVGILFLQGRLYFHHADGSRAKANGGAPSVLIAYGQDNVEVLRGCKIPGKLVSINQ